MNPRPSKPYQVTFRGEGLEKVVEVDPARIPYGHNGEPGSLLDIALGVGIQLDHACGGVCACSTCHVVVKRGLGSCNEAEDEELDQLDHAPDLKPDSRLACQTVPDGSSDLEVRIPLWNRNLIKEAHG